jgi:protein-L-isoaspartate(D-aspartate) O-methyltransferase
MSLEAARHQMIGHQLRAWEVLDARVLGVMEALPRELFVPPDWRGLAYADTEIPLGPGVVLAPPKIQGRALQAVLPGPGEHALEIGSATGYLTACLARLAGSVTGVELHADLAAAARRNLDVLGIRNADVVEGDGLVMEFDRLFDVICLNGSIPGSTARFERMLAMGGRMFVVAGRPPIMQARRITRISESEWTTDNIFETCLPPLENAPQPAEFVF